MRLFDHRPCRLGLPLHTINRCARVGTAFFAVLFPLTAGVGDHCLQFGDAGFEVPFPAVIQRDAEQFMPFDQFRLRQRFGFCGVIVFAMFRTGSFRDRVGTYFLGLVAIHHPQCRRQHKAPRGRLCRALGRADVLGDEASDRGQDILDISIAYGIRHTQLPLNLRRSVASPAFSLNRCKKFYSLPMPRSTRSSFLPCLLISAGASLTSLK